MPANIMANIQDLTAPIFAWYPVATKALPSLGMTAPLRLLGKTQKEGAEEK